MDKINFQNLPSTTTPVNASNLNLMQDNIEDGFNTGLTTVYSTTLGETTGVVTETTLLETTILEAGTYLFLASIPINYYGQNGRELYIRLKVNNVKKWYSIGVVNAYIYALSTMLMSIVEVPANANIKITVQDITGKTYACQQFDLHYIKLK